MDPSLVRFAEHFATFSSLSLEAFCNTVSAALNLPPFELDSENETEWGQVLTRGVEYNVSRPYEENTLQTWDDSVPDGSNFGITVSITLDCNSPRTPEESAGALVPELGRVLANKLDATVYHHRTWLGPGDNRTRQTVFSPEKRSS